LNEFDRLMGKLHKSGDTLQKWDSDRNGPNSSGRGLEVFSTTFYQEQTIWEIVTVSIWTFSALWRKN